jgi:hypothetical protein
MKLGLVLLSLTLSGCHSIDRGSYGFFDRSLNSKSHSYQVVNDPTGTAQTAKVERFEVRPGDRGTDPGWSDCKNDRERSDGQFSVGVTINMGGFKSEVQHPSFNG